MPYKNRVLVYTMTGAQIQDLLNYSVSRSGSDFFSQVSGVRFKIVNGNQATNIQILKDPANPAAGYARSIRRRPTASRRPISRAKLAGGYKDIFAQASFRDTGIADIRDEVRAYIKANSPVSARLDGRISSGAAPPAPAQQPAQLPKTSGAPATALLVALLGGLLLALGLGARRSARP